jgi:hypothetical protein
MNENDGTTVVDSSGNDKNGVLDKGNGDNYPAWTTAMKVTNTHHRGKQVKANIKKNER